MLDQSYYRKADEIIEHYGRTAASLIPIMQDIQAEYRYLPGELLTYVAKEIGVKEARDQVETALYLGKQPYVDKNRIGIWGWSYGGYMTIMSMSEGTPVFKAGVAVAAPTDWRFYDTIYTERFMRTPKENAEGYKESSGMADDNVHFQNCTEYAEHLVQLGKQFDMQVYTNRNHSIYGGNTRNHLYTRLTNFFLNNL